jgi:hypothetical protein
MWVPRIFCAPNDKQITLQICKVISGFKVTYYIKGIGAQPEQSKLRMWVDCRLSKQDFLDCLHKVRYSKSLEVLASLLYDDYEKRRIEENKEKTLLELEDNLEQIYTMFEE